MDIKQNILGNDFNDPVNPLSVAGGYRGGMMFSLKHKCVDL